MIYLLEGADGTGKTTLARDLSARLDLEYYHFGVPDEHPIAYWFKSGLRDVTNHAVVDRLHLSEEVYGSVYRDGSQLTPFQFWALEGWLRARNTALIVCSVPLENMLANNSDRSGPYHDDRQIRVATEFNSVFTNLPRYEYDYTVGFSAVKGRLLSDQAGFDRWVDCGFPGLGSLRPTVWLVGDQPNPRGHCAVEGFDPPFYCTSGQYLYAALIHTGLWWDNLFVSNSRDKQGNLYPLAERWHALGTPATVALGEQASKMLWAHGVPHNKVPHPQWWRRFRHHRMEEYADVITAAAR